MVCYGVVCILKYLGFGWVSWKIKYLFRRCLDGGIVGKGGGEFCYIFMGVFVWFYLF